MNTRRTLAQAFGLSLAIAATLRPGAAPAQQPEAYGAVSLVRSFGEAPVITLPFVRSFGSEQSASAHVLALHRSFAPAGAHRTHDARDAHGTQEARSLATQEATVPAVQDPTAPTTVLPAVRIMAPSTATSIAAAQSATSAAAAPLRLLTRFGSTDPSQDPARPSEGAVRLTRDASEGAPPLLRDWGVASR